MKFKTSNSLSKFLMIGLIFAIVIVTCLYSPFVTRLVSKPEIKSFPASFSLDLNKANFFRQSLNNCGSYSVAAALNIFDSELVDPELIASKINFKLKDRFTLPIGLEWYLHNQNMKVENTNVIGLNDSDKINFLKSNLSQGRANIILVKNTGSSWYYLHYITVIGYDETDFWVYDSLAPRDGQSNFTIDFNGTNPGNKSIPKEELIKIWNDGNILNYLKNYNLSVWK